MIQTIKESEENTNSKEENKILQLIKNRALNIEEIMKETEFSLLECMQLLTLLKFKNLIIELPGKHYQKANESI